MAQAQSAMLASPPCAQYSVFLAAILFVWPLDHSFTSGSRCFLLFGKAVFFLRCLRLRLAFVQSLFIRNLGRQSWRDVSLCVWLWFLLGAFRMQFHGSKVRQQLGGGVFVRRNDCGLAFTRLAVKRLTNLAVKRSTSLAV